LDAGAGVGLGAGLVTGLVGLGAGAVAFYADQETLALTEGLQPPENILAAALQAFSPPLFI